MKVRTRLVLAFAYILLTVIVALTVPLAFNLRARAVSELVGQAKVTAQALAAVIGAEALAPAERDQLQARAEVYSEQIDGRVLILNADGVVLADANPFPEPPTSAVGENYNTPARQEIGIALDGQPEARDSAGRRRRSRPWLDITHHRNSGAIRARSCVSVDVHGSNGIRAERIDDPHRRGRGLVGHGTWSRRRASAHGGRRRRTTRGGR